MRILQKIAFLLLVIVLFVASFAVLVRCTCVEIRHDVVIAKAVPEATNVTTTEATVEIATITTITSTTMTSTTTTTTTTTTTVETTTTEVTTTTTESTTGEKPEHGSEAYLLAYAMSREAAYGNYTDALYVGNVILNRVADPDFPNTVKEVLEAPGQYSWGDVSYSESYIYDDYLYEIAETLLSGYRVLPSNVVYQALFAQGSGVYTIVGNQYYCYK